MAFPIQIDAHQLSHFQFMIPGVTAEWTDTQTVQSWEMSEGRHTFTCDSGHSLEFTVTADGTVEYDSVYDQCVSGRGTTRLELVGVAIEIDPRPLSPTEFYLDSIIPPWASTQATYARQVLPGDYRFRSLTGPDCAFTVTPHGTIAYDPANDGFLSGRDSATLTLRGVAIEIDPRPLSPTEFYLDSIIPPWASTQATYARQVLPGDYRFRSLAGPDCTFTVTPHGTIAYDPANDGFLSGRDSATLTLRGVAITIDPQLLSHTDFYLVGGIIPPWASTQAIYARQMLPGDYRFISLAGPDCAFTVTPHGTIAYDPANDGFLSGRDSATLTLRGVAIAIDPRPLSPTDFYLVGGIIRPWTSTQAIYARQVLPGDYRFISHAGPECTFTVTPHGTIAYDPAFDGFLTGRGSPTLTLRGYVIGIDAGSFQKTAIRIDPVGVLTDVAKPDPDSITLLPYANYTLRLLDPPKQAMCVVGQDGTVQLIGGDDFLVVDSQGNRPVIRFIENPEAGTALAIMADPAISGYLSGVALAKQFPETNTAGQYWMRSGIAGFAEDAKDHFYLPERYTDPFGNVTTLAYDGKYDLFIQSSTDALGNKSGIAMVRSDPADLNTERPRFDYRVLAPIEMVDPNGNRAEVYVDILGMVVATAVKGKGSEADDLTGFDDDLANPSADEVQAFCTASEMDVQQASEWLKHATGRFVYHFGETRDTTGKVTDWATRPAGACGIIRERHASQVALDPAHDNPLQVALECSDGSGNVLMKKAQAEPEHEGGPLRWIINGLTVLNNKGKPVKQYEPSFSKKGFGCEMPPAEGVTPLMYYDAAGRLIRTEMPDGTYSRVEFSPWHVKSFDANDTAYDPNPVNPNHSDWYWRRTDPTHPLYATFNTLEDHRAAELIKAHADTPGQVHLDSLGREVIAIAHNRTNGIDDKYLIFTKLDAEGKPLWICDARGNLVMQYITPPKPTRLADTSANPRDTTDTTREYLPVGSVPCYDIAGNLLFQHSMDAGDRWMLNDAAGKTMIAWDINERQDANNALVMENRLYATEYDALHRPIVLKLGIDGNAPIVIEKFIYQDAQQQPTNNLNGQLTHHYDASSLSEIKALDFKGSPLKVHRTLVRDATSTITDWQGDLPTKLAADTYVQITEYDALKRMTKLFNWHRGTGSRVAVYIPEYGERGVLKAEKLVVGAEKTAEGYKNGQVTHAIVKIRYDAKGQREYLELGNGVTTTYTYDRDTFRLVNLHSTRDIAETCVSGTGSMFVDDRTVQDLRYCYDPVGNITEITDPAFKTVHFDNQEVKPINRNEYDAMYRLISATGRENGAASGMPSNIEGALLTDHFPCIADNAFRNYTQRYEYDAVGNILQMGHHTGGQGNWTRRYQYAFNDLQQLASNRLWRTWQGSGDWDSTTANNKVTYHYDTHGSMLNLADVPTEFRLRWDHRDMIASINLGNGFVHYQYDAGKQRTRKWIDRSEQVTNGNTQNITEERMYLGGLEIYEKRVNGAVKQRIETLHLFDGEQRLLMVDQIDDTDKGKSTLYRYTLSNHLGSSTLELDDQAKLISYEEYHPYGTSAYQAGRNAAEVKLKRYRYTGMERDEESGLSYHATRQYATALCRWLSADPNGLGDGVNVYSYVGARPLLKRDSTGMAGDPSDLFAAGKAWENEILTTLESKFKVVRQVTVKATIDGEEITSVLDALSETKSGYAVFESKLNPTTELTKAQEKLMSHIEQGGQFTIAAGNKKESLLRSIFGVSDKTPITAKQYLVLHQGNASQVLQELKAIGSDEIGTIAKGGELMVLTRSEAAEAYKLVEANQGMLWKDAVGKVRGAMPGVAVAAIAALVMLAKPAQAASADAATRRSNIDDVENVASSSESLGLFAMAGGGLASAAGNLLEAPKLTAYGGGLIKYGGYLTAPLTLYQAQKDVRSEDPWRQITGSLNILGVGFLPAAVFSAELKIMEPGIELFNEMIVRTLGSRFPLGIGAF